VRILEPAGKQVLHVIFECIINSRKNLRANVDTIFVSDAGWYSWWFGMCAKDNGANNSQQDQ
jgi:hypothetical protein